mgnify:CR=1 FL=1
MKLDRYDQQILDILQLDGRINNQDLAERIGLSPSPCLRRVRALEESGLIVGYRALLNAKKLGFSIVVLLLPTLLLVYFLIIEKQGLIDFTQQEVAGVEYLRSLQKGVVVVTAPAFDKSQAFFTGHTTS